MPSSVSTFLPVVGDVGPLGLAFDGDPAAWLADAKQDGAPDQWIVSLHAGSLRRNVRMKIGSPWRSGTTRWRSLSWDPIGPDGEAAPLDRFLPSLDGELGLHAVNGRTTLVLDGRYRPPGGLLGTAADAVALRRVAQTTVGAFLAAVAARLSAEAMAYGQPSVERQA